MLRHVSKVKREELHRLFRTIQTVLKLSASSELDTFDVLGGKKGVQDETEGVVS